MHDFAVDSSVYSVLGPDGPLSRSMPGYEHREGQLQMAQAVEQSLAHDHVLVCEAGTGTGKTLAYLVPAILSGRKVVVSTATKALQDQILKQDIPCIEQHLGLRPRVALAKGLSNYLCRRRYETFRASAAAATAHHARSLARIQAWLRGHAARRQVRALPGLLRDAHEAARRGSAHRGGEPSSGICGHVPAQRHGGTRRCPS
ncbi:MAG: DEAD/DEAH box helicase [Polyangiaceae bacterium]|nr:DEAD/DEAH box helicase [Polyangiaceae bacterium]